MRWASVFSAAAPGRERGEPARAARRAALRGRLAAANAGTRVAAPLTVGAGARGGRGGAPRGVRGRRAQARGEPGPVGGEAPAIEAWISSSGRPASICPRVGQSNHLDELVRQCVL